MAMKRSALYFDQIYLIYTIILRYISMFDSYQKLLEIFTYFNYQIFSKDVNYGSNFQRSR